VQRHADAQQVRRAIDVAQATLVLRRRRQGVQQKGLLSRRCMRTSSCDTPPAAAPTSSSASVTSRAEPAASGTRPCGGCGRTSRSPEPPSLMPGLSCRLAGRGLEEMQAGSLALLDAAAAVRPATARCRPRGVAAARHDGAGGAAARLLAVCCSRVPPAARVPLPRTPPSRMPAPPLSAAWLHGEHAIARATTRRNPHAARAEAGIAARAGLDERMAG
jgi:hypothetical protein